MHQPAKTAQVFIHDLLQQELVLPLLVKHDMIGRTTATLTALCHEALIGSGLRSKDVGAVVATSAAALPVKANVIAETVTSQLALAETGTLGFSGPLSYYDGLLHARANVDAGRFSHVLHVHIGTPREKPDGWHCRVYVSLVGTTRGHIAVWGVAFGEVPTSGALRDHVRSELCRRTGTDAERATAIHLTGPEQEEAALPVAEQLARGVAGECAIVASRENDRFGAVLLETVAAKTQATSGKDGSIETHLARAELGEFSLSFARVSLKTNDVAPMALLAEEARLVLRGSLRVFDDVKPLGGTNYLLSLPRADEKALSIIQKRIEHNLREIDLAGDLTVDVEFKGLTVGKSRLTAGDVKAQLAL